MSKIFISPIIPPIINPIVKNVIARPPAIHLWRQYLSSGLRRRFLKPEKY